jgi:hypothetical protein
VPAFERAGVRAVFSAHDHAYERLERSGVRYFVSGGGGAPLHQQSAKCPPYDREALKLFRAAFHFLRVEVRGDEALLDAVDADGQTIEHVALHEPPAPPAAPPTPVPYRDLPGPRSRAPWELFALAAAIVVLAALVFVARRRRRA